MKFWHLCGPKIFFAASTWLKTGQFPHNINSTSIALVPKINNPKTMEDYHLISLLNIIYKIISKTLANPLKPLLNKCFSHEQYSFIEDHSILDNVVIDSGSIQHMKCKTRGEMGELALKIDIRPSIHGWWGNVDQILCSSNPFLLHKCLLDSRFYGRPNLEDGE